MKRSSVSFAYFAPVCLVAFVACSDTDEPGRDATTTTDGFVADGGDHPDAASTGMDAQPLPDATTIDGGTTDASPPDTGQMLAAMLAPGEYVQVPAARINVALNRLDGNSDTLETVSAKLGPGVRSATPNTRSYTWTLADGTELGIWFVNNDLAGGDTIEMADRVLWIAVSGSFTGTTNNGIGLGSARSAVENVAAYGAPARTVPIPNPAGTLAQYFREGMLVAYDTSDNVRSITISRAYPKLPDGAISLAGGSIDLDGQSIQGTLSIQNRGTPRADVVTILGEPDAQDTVTIGTVDMLGMSYAYIGIELFVGSATDRTLWLSLHAPYYGTAGTVGIGSTRTDFETYLTQQTYGAGMNAPNTPGLVCYEHTPTTSPDVGVSYSSDVPPEVTSITTPLLSCP